MKHKTGIICTLGPASQKGETILQMAKAGMSVARLNFSHGEHRMHQQLIDTIRQVNKKYRCDIKILQDLEGYRIRIGLLDKPIEIKKHQRVWMTNHKQGKTKAIPLHFDGDIKSIDRAMDVYVDDGNLHLQVIGFSKRSIELEVLQGGIIKSKKGVNIPQLKLKGNILTDKDKRDMEFGIRNKVDYVAQSFVRNRMDILRVAKIVKPHLPDCQIIAKIENNRGVQNVDSIMDACDGILIARGDLGVSLPIFKIPMIQKDIIQRCIKKKTPVFVATQMLESMTEHIRPTRAEVSDVANAILDGADCVMLSGETAVGSFPVRTVRMMNQIIKYTEQEQRAL